MRTQTYFHTKLQSEANRKNDTVPLQVNCVGAVSEALSFSTRAVRRDFYYIYVLKGEMLLADCRLLPGDVIVFEPGYDYQYTSRGETAYLWVHYTGFEARSLTQSAGLILNRRHHIGVQREIISCFRQLFREFIINDAAAGQLCLCILREILLFTARYAASDSKNNLPLLAIEYIHRSFREPVRIDALARMENMSCTAFRLAFKRHTGVSPNEYIISQRISAACQLLSQTDKSVLAIANDVGYPDPYYFSRIFRKKMGMSPLKYRSSQKS
ncbi:MAG: AraC family transcriptional regulator [Lachnospiraceae bacterium]|nr:AraC family transcriptional regulator [Lachnospiraceae bacterium]